jgi:ribosome-associated translation inhibitor RaiA
VVDVHLTAQGDLPREKLEAARERITSLQRYTDEPLTDARVTVREGKPHAARPFTADVSVRVAGRRLAAHTAGRTPDEAVDRAVERLRRQLQRITKSEVALRNEPQHLPEPGLKPPDKREIVHRHPYLAAPLSTIEAVRELLDLDLQFFLFTHVRTGEDVVVYRRDDGDIGLIHPRGSALADENDIVVAEPSRYSEPLTLDRAREEMDVLNHRFLYFTDAADGRGKVIYLRHDGDYGLVEPHA